MSTRGVGRLYEMVARYEHAPGVARIELGSTAMLWLQAEKRRADEELPGVYQVPAVECDDLPPRGWRLIDHDSAQITAEEMPPQDPDD